MIRGSCLCEGVEFELARISGPFELCHCNRCRKVSGSAFVAAVGVKRADYRLVRGADLITHFELPIRHEPPAYGYSFCRRCGCIVPPAEPKEPWFEVAAGLLDGELHLTPERHIFVEHAPRWAPITDALPQMDAAALARHRAREDSDPSQE